MANKESDSIRRELMEANALQKACTLPLVTSLEIEVSGDEKQKQRCKKNSIMKNICLNHLMKDLA